VNLSEPLSVKAAQIEMQSQTELLHDIENQLDQRRGNPNRILSATESCAWRSKAIKKMGYVKRRLASLRSWIKEHSDDELVSAFGTYCVHVADCTWWDDKPCDCGLNPLLDDYGLERLQKEDVEL